MTNEMYGNNYNKNNWLNDTRIKNPNRQLTKDMCIRLGIPEVNIGVSFKTSMCHAPNKEAWLNMYHLKILLESPKVKVTPILKGIHLEKINFEGVGYHNDSTSSSIMLEPYCQKSANGYGYGTLYCLDACKYKD